MAPTIDRDAKILAMWNEGIKVCAIGKRFGISHQRVCQILKKMGHEGVQARTQRKVETARALREDGVPVALIGRDLGVAPKTAGAYLYYAKFKSR